ncbi:hypothetical protein KKC97_11625, partial [bacterium]|nr:hypothetical protein [bacterium]
DQFNPTDTLVQRRGECAQFIPNTLGPPASVYLIRTATRNVRRDAIGNEIGTDSYPAFVLMYTHIQETSRAPDGSDLIEVDDDVREGQTLGLFNISVNNWGALGYSGKPHLDYELHVVVSAKWSSSDQNRVNFEPLDPLPFLNQWSKDYYDFGVLSSTLTWNGPSIIEEISVEQSCNVYPCHDGPQSATANGTNRARILFFRLKLASTSDWYCIPLFSRVSDVDRRIMALLRKAFLRNKKVEINSMQTGFFFVPDAGQNISEDNVIVGARLIND